MFTSIENIKHAVTFHGRYAIYDGKLNADWVGAGFSFNFKGDSVRIFFETEAGDVPVYLHFEIDGRAQKVAVSNSSEVLVIDNLPLGTHSFNLFRITEIDASQRNIKDYLFITGIDLGLNGELIPAEQGEKKMLIDFYGDSITNAWQVLSCPQKNTRLQCDNDYSASYAYLSAKALNAEARVCAVSGRGIISHCEGDRSEPMKLFYPMRSRYLPIKMDFSEKPDVIVSALGTNDCCAQVPEDEMKEGISDFIRLLRSDAPDAEIIWLYGAMNRRYIPMMEELFSALGAQDKKLSFLPVDLIDPEKGEVGGICHPSRIGEMRIADELIAHIKKRLGIN